VVCHCDRKGPFTDQGGDEEEDGRPNFEQQRVFQVSLRPGGIKR